MLELGLRRMSDFRGGLGVVLLLALGLSGGRVLAADGDGDGSGPGEAGPPRHATGRRPKGSPPMALTCP